MNAKLQKHLAFFLTGRSVGSDAQQLNGQFRPALFSQYSDLTSLRYDFPLILNKRGSEKTALQSLSGSVDDAVESLAKDPECDRIARDGYRLESVIRKGLEHNKPVDFAEIWKTSANRLAADGNKTVLDSAARLFKIFNSNGDLIDAGSLLPARTVHHAWSTVQENKAFAFRQKAERLLQKLRDILNAEKAGSGPGRSPESLKSGVGSSFETAFDFAAMSQILSEATPEVVLSDDRRNRIIDLIAVLEAQRFYSLQEKGPEPYNFSFERCSDALDAYQERHAKAVELAKTLRVADLEVTGEYRESVHNVIFESFGANGLDADELAEMPEYLVCTDARSLDPAETARLIEVLAAGLPFKVLVRTDDVLEPSKVTEGHVALGIHARQLVDTALGLTDVFVFQTSASMLFKMRESLFEGFIYNGPSLFSVFSGDNGHTGDHPSYLVAAAAAESRVFPSLVYDPAAGSDWASCLNVGDNPHPDDDWPKHTFFYENKELQAQSEELAFTLADFMAMDDRFFEHFMVIPGIDWGEELISIPEALQSDVKGLPEKIPYVTLVDNEDRLQRAILESRTLLETRRCQSMWHSLQELGGIHNSHAERLLAQERKAQADASQPEAVEVPTKVAETTEPETPGETGQIPAVEPVAEEINGDDPYIETARCTTCNECTELNSEMFAYNEDKQAYIANPEAGTFRQLVEAAEGCQVSIIHPGKPRNPKEPGLEDLIKRAAEFV